MTGESSSACRSGPYLGSSIWLWPSLRRICSFKTWFALRPIVTMLELVTALRIGEPSPLGYRTWIFSTLMSVL